jgi:hypothetical protein
MRTLKVKKPLINTYPGLGLGIEYHPPIAFIPGLLTIRIAFFEINITT